MDEDDGESGGMKIYVEKADRATSGSKKRGGAVKIEKIQVDNYLNSVGDEGEEEEDCQYK